MSAWMSTPQPSHGQHGVASSLADCGTREPSPHTSKPYGQDFDGAAGIIVGDADAGSRMPLSDLLAN
jgi:hypothetical protein